MTWNPLLLAHIVNVKIPRLIPVSSKGSRHVYVMNACKRYQRSKIFYISKKILQPTQPVTWSKLCIPDLDEAPRLAASVPESFQETQIKSDLTCSMAKEQQEECFHSVSLEKVGKDKR